MYAIHKALTKLSKKWDNNIPLCALRGLLPHTPREVLDAELYRLEGEDQIEFSALTEPMHYSSEEISAGIGSEQRLLFFVRVLKDLTKSAVKAGPELTLEKLEGYELLAQELREMEAHKAKLEERIAAKKREIEEHMRVDETHVRSTPETRIGHESRGADPYPIIVDIANVTSQMQLVGLNQYDKHIKPIWAALWSRPQTVKELSELLGVSVNVIRRRLKVLGDSLIVVGKTGNSKMWGVKEDVKKNWRSKNQEYPKPTR